MADDRIAKPGDPGLDCHLTGLRLAAIAQGAGKRFTIEAVLTFDTSEAAGWWTDRATGETFFPERVTSLDAAFGVQMMPGFGYLARKMLARLEAWRADGSLIAMTSAPGKWTLLHCPEHPAGAFVPIPRREVTADA